MSEQTPLEAFLASRASELREGCERNDGRGAMFRLMKRMDTVQITDWIDAEYKRGITNDVIAEALANYIANLIAPMCVPKGPGALIAAHWLLSNAMRNFTDMASGAARTNGVIVSRQDGRQLDVTVEGVFKKGLPRHE